jgi:hypothetical protein
METMLHVLRQQGSMADESLVQWLSTCGELCQAVANLTSVGGWADAQVGLLCAEICESCAAACGAYPEDAQLTACAQACREAVVSCRQLVEAEQALQEPLQESHRERAKRHERQRDEVDESSWQSFPASDPPALSKDTVEAV